MRKVEADPHAKLYMDDALTAVAEEDLEHMELYTQNAAARSAVERELRVAGHKTIGEAAHAHHENGHANARHATNGHTAMPATGTPATITSTPRRSRRPRRQPS